MEGRLRRAAPYLLWLAAMAASAPSWLPAVRVWRGEAVVGSPLVALLGCSYASNVLELRLYRGFAWPLSPVEVRVRSPGGALAYVRQLVPPSRVFTVMFYVKEPQVAVEVYIGGTLALKAELPLTGTHASDCRPAGGQP